MDLKEYLHQRQQFINLSLDNYLPSSDRYAMRLNQAMSYSLKAGGKRLRPILTLASCEAVGGKMQNALPAACAIEFIHTYSLIHDDLPAMDDDDLRRGKPTCHKAFDEATAILAGDALLTQAFVILSNKQNFPNTDADILLSVIQNIAQAVGPNGMVGGQQADMDGEKIAITPEMLSFIHANKTGALLTTSIVTGALLGNANQQQLNNLTKFGQLSGLAFQIADDILDITSTREQLGKSIGKDKEQNKATYPALYGLDAAREKAQQLCAQALKALERFDKEADPLREIAQYIVQRKH